MCYMFIPFSLGLFPDLVPDPGNFEHPLIFHMVVFCSGKILLTNQEVFQFIYISLIPLLKTEIAVNFV